MDIWWYMIINSIVDINISTSYINGGVILLNPHLFLDTYWKYLQMNDIDSRICFEII